jgi:hypothetical protein
VANRTGLPLAPQPALDSWLAPMPVVIQVRQAVAWLSASCP